MTNTFDQTMNHALNRRYTRRGLLKGSLVAGAGALALTAFGGSFMTRETLAAQEARTAAGPLDSDLDILNYALTLEFLEAAAYKAVLGLNVLSGRALTYFQAFGAHEQAHVDALLATIPKLGGTPVSPPAGGYNFSSVPKDMPGIIKFFQTVESVGASAYLGAAPSIQNANVLDAALSIHAVEAEHTSALADLVAPGSDLFAPEAFATPRTPAEVMQIVAPFFATSAPAPTTPPPAMPGLPNTGGGGSQTPGNGLGLRELLGGLGIVGVGAATAAALSRQRTTRVEGGREPQSQQE